MMIAVLTIALTVPIMSLADDEMSLFDARGTATAYVALDDELTVSLWSGKPVAYLERDSCEGFHVYGFNGNHLGWFVSGFVYDHSGKGDGVGWLLVRSVHSAGQTGNGQIHVLLRPCLASIRGRRWI